MNGISVSSLVKRGWMLIVAVVVVGVAGLTVYRLHGIFGSDQDTSPASGVPNEIVSINPKRVILEVFGPSGTVATINYLNVHAEPQLVLDTSLPWSYEITTTDPVVLANVVAQGDRSFLGCRITVDGVVRDERIVNTMNAYTFCQDNAA